MSLPHQRLIPMILDLVRCNVVIVTDMLSCSGASAFQPLTYTVTFSLLVRNMQL